MKSNAMHDTWLGALITFEVAAQFAWLSAIAITLRALALQSPPRR